MKRLFLVFASLGLALVLPCRAAVTVSSEFGSGLTRDDARNQFSEEVLTNGFEADVASSGFSVGASNSIEIGKGDKGFEKGGGNLNSYDVSFKKKIGETYSWGASASYTDYLAEDSDDEWSLGVWGQVDFNESVGLCLSFDQTFETTSSAEPWGYSAVTLSVPMTWTINEEFSVPIEPAISYNAGSTPLDAAFIASCDTGVDWQVNKRFLWSILKASVIGTIEHVHDKRNGKAEFTYATAVGYTF